MNLCINARDAMPDGGRLTIETADRWLDERTARERDLPAGQYVSMCVSDTGCGMSPKLWPRRSTRFHHQADRSGHWTRLSMIYGFAKQSGGPARIYSEADHGTTVCIYLPRHLGDLPLPEFGPEKDDAPQAGKGQIVLVVDDEPTVRMLVSEVLEDAGYRAIEAADGAAGLQVPMCAAPTELLVTDLGMPGGLHRRQGAGAARPGLKVLFITGYAENAVLSHGQLEPGMHLLTKPVEIRAVAGRIKDLIGPMDRYGRVAGLKFSVSYRVTHHVS